MLFRGLTLYIYIVLALVVSCAAENKVSLDPLSPKSPDARFVANECLVQDDFDHSIDLWKVELEKGGTVVVREGSLEIDVPGGCTVWLKSKLTGPILISYDTTVVSSGGPNDRVSDLNCFWMANDTRSVSDIFGWQRSGKFSDYDQLKCYYVGQGGNSNKTTRFRRYIGEKGNRPILPEHDLSAKEFLLEPNVSQTIQLIAAGKNISYYRDGRIIFSYDDPEPYTSGWFAIRTVTNHLRIKNFRVHRLSTSPEKNTTQAATTKP
jgi:hypothetical protein